MHTKPELKTIKGFAITGLATRTRNQDEIQPDTAKIPSLWHNLHTEVLSKSNAATTFGVYHNYESDDRGYYTLTAGTKATTPTDHLDTIQIVPGNYLVFSNHGPQPEAIIMLWQAVWSYFQTEVQYQRAYKTDFEVYHEENCEIYIGI